MARTQDHIIAGTGSRKLQLADPRVKLLVANMVQNELRERNTLYTNKLVVMSGMAEGFDSLLARAAIGFGIPLWCVLPHKGYGNYYWGDRSVTGQNNMAEFSRILNKAQRVTYVMEDVYHSHGLHVNGRHANHLRNDFMVATADEFLVWDPTSRGTSSCLSSITLAGTPFKILEVEEDR